MTTDSRRRLLMDVPETGRALRIGRTKVYELIDQGEIETVKIGRRRLITAASVEAYVARLAGERVATG